MTNLVDPTKRYDAYGECLTEMRKYIPSLPNTARQDLKDAVMTVLYGSIKEPERIFGEGTKEIEAFYKAVFTMAPGAFELLEILRNSWNSYGLCHSWVMPDNHHVHVKVMQTVEERIEVDELNTSFVYRYKENIGKRKGVSNVANVIHSIDAYLVRSIIRRCNYDSKVVESTQSLIQIELHAREHASYEHVIGVIPREVGTALSRYNDTQMIDAVVIPMITHKNVKSIPTEYLITVLGLIDEMVAHAPFDLITVHDEFKCSPNHMNVLRWHYKEIMAELAESTILDDVLESLYGQSGEYEKLSNNLGDIIRQSNYSIC